MPEKQPSTRNLASSAIERHHRINYFVQRIGWCCMLLILGAALLGLLGQGYVTHRRATTDDGALSVDYYRIERYESPAKLTIRVQDLPSSEPVRLYVSKAFFDDTTPESVSPVPIGTRIEGDEAVYDFAVANANELTIVYRYRHDEIGRLSYQIRHHDRPPVTIRQFVLP